jgi:hypothetical protein
MVLPSKVSSVSEWLYPDRLDKAVSAKVPSGYQIAASIIWVHTADQSLSRVRKVADAFALIVSLDTALVLPPSPKSQKYKINDTQAFVRRPLLRP